MNFREIHDARFEPQREKIRALCMSGMYEQAGEIARTTSDEALIFTPCEAMADHLCGSNPVDAARLYAIAAEMWIYEGTQATGSGEGLLAMDHLKALEIKLKSIGRRLNG